MINCYKLIGKQILSLSSGQIIGIIKNIEIKNMRLSRMLAFNDNSEIEEEFLINAKDVYSFGENAITLKKEDVTIDETYLNAKLVGSVVFNQEGVTLDTINDILIDEKSFKVIEFVGENRKYKPTEIFSVGNGVIVLKGMAKVTKAKSIKQIKVQNADNVVKTLENKVQTTSKPENVASSNTITLSNNIVVDRNIVLNRETIDNGSNKTVPASPQKTLANFDFLIGRVISNNVYSANGECILNVGEIINNKTVINAFENNFLKSLLENSKPV